MVWITGIAAACCLLTPMLYAILKRSAADIKPRFWFMVHVVVSSCGLPLVLLHSNANLTSPPALLLLLVVLVMALGSWIRIAGGKGYAARMGARPAAFLARDPARRERLRQLLDEKISLLSHLEPAAAEAGFSPQLGHWLSRPVLSLRYLMLAERERDLTGARLDAGPIAGWARRWHMAGGVLFIAGLAVHVSVALHRLVTGGGA